MCVHSQEEDTKRHEEKGVIVVREGNGRYPMGNDANPRHLG